MREGRDDVWIPGISDHGRARDPQPPGGSDKTRAPIADGVTIGRQWLNQCETEDGRKFGYLVVPEKRP